VIIVRKERKEMKSKIRERVPDNGLLVEGVAFSRGSSSSSSGRIGLNEMFSNKPNKLKNGE
jgi:hypothetical protein